MWNARHPAVVAMAVAIAIGGGWMLKTKLFPKQIANWTSAKVGFADIEETVLATGILKPFKMVAVGAPSLRARDLAERRYRPNHQAGRSVCSDRSRYQTKRPAHGTGGTGKHARATIRKRGDVEFAEASLARQQITFSQKASSRADYETADATVKQTRAQIAALDAQITEAIVSVENARVNLDYTRITAPIDGTVLAVVTQAGQTVNAVQSAPTIAIIGQIETMTIRAEISEVDVIKGETRLKWCPFQHSRRPRSTLHRDAGFHRAGAGFVKNDSSFSSSSSNTASSTSSSSSTSSTTSAIYYNGVFTAANTDGRLRTYMTAEVHIVVARAKNALTIASAAISERNSDGTYRVQVLRAGRHRDSPRREDRPQQQIDGGGIAGPQGGRAGRHGQGRRRCRRITEPDGQSAHGVLSNARSRDRSKQVAPGVSIRRGKRCCPEGHRSDDRDRRNGGHNRRIGIR